MRFVVIPSTVFFHNAGRSTPRISWRVVDVDRGLHPISKFSRVTVATCNDQTTADRIAAHLNGGTRFDEIAWQGCLDHANKNAAAARADADRVRNQLFEAREQRDEARADARNAWAELKKQPNGGFWTGSGSITVYNEHREPETIVSILDRVQKAEAGEVKMRLEAARALTEVDALRKQRDAHVCAAPVNVYSSTPPHDHVVMSLANYSKLVTERDEALAKYAACVDTVSFVDGRWVRTS